MIHKFATLFSGSSLDLRCPLCGTAGQQAVGESSPDFIVFQMLGAADAGCSKCRFSEMSFAGEEEASLSGEQDG